MDEGLLETIIIAALRPLRPCLCRCLDHGKAPERTRPNCGWLAGQPTSGCCAECLKPAPAACDVARNRGRATTARNWVLACKTSLQQQVLRRHQTALERGCRNVSIWGVRSRRGPSAGRELFRCGAPFHSTVVLEKRAPASQANWDGSGKTSAWSNRYSRSLEERFAGACRVLRRRRKECGSSGGHGLWHGRPALCHTERLTVSIRQMYPSRCRRSGRRTGGGSSHCTLHCTGAVLQRWLQEGPPRPEPSASQASAAARVHPLLGQSFNEEKRNSPFASDQNEAKASSLAVS
jgi:hypothetical protein